jgi:pimeloyl-ACP methyl ester carboxylesterase
MDRRSFLSLSAAGLVLPSVALAQQPGPFQFKPMRGDAVEAEWGAFEVPEERRDPKSRRITLRYVRFRTTAAKPGYPLVYLAGGPGGSGVGTARGPRFPIFQALREVGDVIAFDQRGTGASNQIPRLKAATPEPAALDRAGMTAFARTELERCWAEWTKQGVAMRGYNTIESAHDLEDLRVHLGAEKLNLWGISYGSHLGQAAVKYHGDRIHRIALASLEGLDQTVKRPARIDGFLREADRLIASNRGLRAEIPDLLALMRRVHARLDNDPLEVPLKPPARFGAFPVQMLSGGLVKNPNTLVLLPRLYLELDRGRTDMLARFAPMMGDLGVGGMPEAMDIASGMSPAKRALVEREAKTAVLGDSFNFPMPQLSGAIPGIDLGDRFRAGFKTDVPALLIAGTLDGRTPLAEQAEVAAQFRRKAQLTVVNAGHDVLEAHPDVGPLLVRFFKGEKMADTTLTLPPPRFA